VLAARLAIAADVDAARAAAAALRS